ncbi:hypothetical protein BK007_09345 [Methanobacterium subterraneum]|jgi:hypothetical protein|uniref:UPF0179 protein BK007_09345 n=1 Tax=Methanobacterium subterraneum TaxID=59277 RepID=A0A2H4VDR5_9EURY|nr:UPF0179 family protein [Methanobacterium subterraneum]AUB56190.1 hypothetical protein BK007_09345 [Methanobacterium subterraneum]
MITLIGKNLAEKGIRFMHYGAASQCEKCRFKTTCIESLEEGRIYRVKEVKNTEHPCMIHDGGKVKVVDVDRAVIKAAIDSKRAFEGSNIVFNPPECDEDCSLRELCFPEGLYPDDKCKIVKKMGKPVDKCAKGLNLTVVMLKY